MDILKPGDLIKPVGSEDDVIDIVLSVDKVSDRSYVKRIKGKHRLHEPIRIMELQRNAEKIGEMPLEMYRLLYE